MPRIRLATTAALALATWTACFGPTGTTFVMYDLVSVDGTALPAQSSSGSEITRGILTLFDHDLSFSLGITVLGQDGSEETTWSEGRYVESESTIEFVTTTVDGNRLEQEVAFVAMRNAVAIMFESQDGDEYWFLKWSPLPANP